jgi:hypothetical protein
MNEPIDYQGIGCDEFAQMAAELALGVLTGRERAVALAHLDGCESCRELVRELTMTGEELLALLPSREPPAGFESRVLERIGVSAPRPPIPLRTRPRSRMRNLLAAAAVVVALVGAGLGGWGLRTATTPTAESSEISTAALFTSGHQMVGQVFVYNHSPWWMYMSVNLSGGSITVKCELENSAGQYQTVGKFRLDDGYGIWGSPYQAQANGTIIGARLVGANGAVLASATLN